MKPALHCWACESFWKTNTNNDDKQQAVTVVLSCSRLHGHVLLVPNHWVYHRWTVGMRYHVPVYASRSAILWGNAGPHLIGLHGFVGPPSTYPQMASCSVQPFLQDSRPWPAYGHDNHTDWHTHTHIACIYTFIFHRNIVTLETVKWHWECQYMNLFDITEMPTILLKRNF